MEVLQAPPEEWPTPGEVAPAHMEEESACMEKLHPPPHQRRWPLPVEIALAPYEEESACVEVLQPSRGGAITC